MARICTSGCRAWAAATADGTSTLAWNASVSSSGTTTISSCLRASRSIVVSSDGLARSRNARSIFRSGRIERTSATRALMVAAERGSRLP